MFLRVSRGEWNEIAGDTIAYLCHLHRGGWDHGTDRAGSRVAICAREQREQPMTTTTIVAERITAALLLVLCVVFAVFV
jgi:hypothetical protein